MISIWECKIGGPLADVPEQFDRMARALLEELYGHLTGRGPDFTITSWDGELTPTERGVMRDRYPDTPEYQ